MQHNRPNPDPSVIDERARDRVGVEGEDVLTYLHSQISQDIRDLGVGESRWTLVLEPSGKVESLARVTRIGEESFVLDTDAGFGDALAARLKRFMIRVRVELTVEPAASPVPSTDHETARIAAGWPRMGREIVPGETIPAATGVLEQAVSFTKGCYPGQELVERMDSRGANAPWSIRIVEVAADAANGDAVIDRDGARVGVITSVSPAGGIALAMVKRGGDVAADRHDVGVLADPD